MSTEINAADPIGSGSFYERLTPVPSFVDLAATDSYVPLPDDWIVVVTDIVTSRREIENGNYKAVNMVGASIIAAVKNTTDGTAFPFVFGGDGATLALPAQYEDAVVSVAAGLQKWAREEFSLELRAGVVPVAAIRQAGRDMCVAKCAASDAVSYAAFSGGGASWLEGRIKAGHNLIEAPDDIAPPNLDGLSCRWSNLQPVNGNIVSLVLEPGPVSTPAEFSSIAKQVLQTIYASTGTSGPMPEEGPGVQFPPPGMDIEARVSRGGKSVLRRYLELSVENLLAWLFFRTGWTLGGFNPGAYARQVSQNSDFQKFEDGLKMTIDCDDATVEWAEAFLSTLKAEGKIRYGIKVQSEALVTCIVPSPLDDDHIHFVDGASGGYAAAASML